MYRKTKSGTNNTLSSWQIDYYGLGVVTDTLSERCIALILRSEEGNYELWIMSYELGLLTIEEYAFRRVANNPSFIIPHSSFITITKDFINSIHRNEVIIGAGFFIYLQGKYFVFIGFG